MEITRRHAEAALTHLDACEKILKASTARVLPNDAYENLLDHLEDAQAAADLARSTPITAAVNILTDQVRLLSHKINVNLPENEKDEFYKALQKAHIAFTNKRP